MLGGCPQVFSACVMSFAHGSNDVANAMGPFSGIYYIWETRQVPTKAPVRFRCAQRCRCFMHAGNQHACVSVALLVMH